MSKPAVVTLELVNLFDKGFQILINTDMFVSKVQILNFAKKY